MSKTTEVSKCTFHSCVARTSGSFRKQPELDLKPHMLVYGSITWVGFSWGPAPLAQALHMPPIASPFLERCSE